MPTPNIPNVFLHDKKIGARAYTQGNSANISSQRVINILRKLHSLLAEPIDERSYFSGLIKGSKLKQIKLQRSNRKKQQKRLEPLLSLKISFIYV